MTSGPNRPTSPEPRATRRTASGPHGQARQRQLLHTLRGLLIHPQPAPPPRPEVRSFWKVTFMTDLIESQPEPEHLARASAALVAVLAGDADLLTRLAVGAALAILGDVHPPYPPLPDPDAPLPAGPGIATALAHLNLALAETSSPQEAIRIGLAGRRLHEIDPLP